MKIMNLFKSKNTKKVLSMSEILNGKDLDHPNVVYMATVIVGEYGAVLEKTSKLIFGASEKLLPYPKPTIQDAIELLLNIFKALSVLLYRKAGITSSNILRNAL